MLRFFHYLLAALMAALFAFRPIHGLANPHYAWSAIQKHELHQVGFTIFQDVESLGYFAWHPDRAVSTRLKNVTLSEIQDCLTFDDATPPPVLPIQKIRNKLPLIFHKARTQSAKVHQNSFPHGQLAAASLYAAVQLHGLDSEIDFIFGGSIFNFLSSDFNAVKSTTSRPVMCLIPGTNTRLICNSKEYSQNNMQPGFQFERLCTGTPMDDPSQLTYYEHLQLWHIQDPNSQDSFRILVAADFEAMDETGRFPCEIKCNNKKYWATRTLTQMVSNGSSSLIHGVKTHNRLRFAQRFSFHKVAKVAESFGYSIPSLEKIFLKNLRMVRDFQHADGGVYSLTKTRSGVRITKSRLLMGGLLPPRDVVDEIMNGARKEPPS